ncbi:MAG: monovalent cation/H(+) antiporter subunit G [Verrucomicrobiota bacterium]
MIINIISVVLILSGLLFFLGAAVGIVRFPDFYTRMHAAGKGDTLSSLLVILGFAVYQLHDLSLASVIVAIKLVGICVFIMITSPTATHALMDAGYEDGVEPTVKRGKDALGGKRETE